MNKQEIKEAIAKGIAGQGSMVDIGGVLPTILNAIVDNMPEGGAIAPEATITVNEVTFQNLLADEAAQRLGISVEQLMDLPNQMIIRTEIGYVLTRVLLLDSRDATVNRIAVFGGSDLSDGVRIKCTIFLELRTDGYVDVQYIEV